MKKILIVVFTFFSSISVVLGQTYYSDYGDFSEWSIDGVVASDTLLVESEKRYKYYHEEITGDYFYENNNPDNFPLVDKNNTKNTETSEWSTTRPDDISNRVINSRRIYNYSKALPIRYIYISDVYGGNNTLRITELRVKSNDKGINYSFVCNGCSDDFDFYAKNGIYNQNYSHIENGGNILIDLGDYYEYSSISLFMYFYDVTDDIKYFNISFLKEVGDNPYLYLNNALSFKCSSLNDYKAYTYNYTNMNVGEIKWSDYKTSLDKVEADAETIVYETLEYNYYDILYYYYRIDREYSDTHSDYYNNQDLEYVEYYRYKKRDKIIIEDNIEINNLDYNLNNYILESTVPVEIKDNVDINKNGSYKVSYITPFITIDKDVIVNIDDNLRNSENNQNELLDKIVNLENEIIKDSNIDTYNSLIEELNNYKIELNALNIEMEYYKNQLGIKENEKNIMSKEFENELINIKLKKDNEIRSLKEQLEIKNTEDNKNWPFLQIKPKIGYLFIFILILFLCSGIYFYKIKKKN